MNFLDSKIRKGVLDAVKSTLSEANTVANLSRNCVHGGLKRYTPRGRNIFF